MIFGEYKNPAIEHRKEETKRGRRVMNAILDEENERLSILLSEKQKRIADLEAQLATAQADGDAMKVLREWLVIDETGDLRSVEMERHPDRYEVMLVGHWGATNMHVGEGKDINEAIGKAGG